MVSYLFVELLGEFVHARDAAGVQDLFFRGVRPRERDVLANRAVEQKRVLQNHAELRAIGIQPHGGQIDAVDQHVP